MPNDDKIIDFLSLSIMYLLQHAKKSTSVHGDMISEIHTDRIIFIRRTFDCSVKYRAVATTNKQHEEEEASLYTNFLKKQTLITAAVVKFAQKKLNKRIGAELAQ